MQNNEFFADSWGAFRELDYPAYHALKKFSDQLPNGPWALVWAFDTDGSRCCYAVTLKSMLTQDERSFHVVRSEHGFSVS